MLTRHFFKTLIGFTILILLGLGGLYLMDEYDKRNQASPVQVEDEK